MGYTYRNSYKDWNLSYGGPLARTNFNPVQGFHTSLEISYFKRLNEYGNGGTVESTSTMAFRIKNFDRPSFLTKNGTIFQDPKSELVEELRQHNLTIGIQFYP